MAASTKYANLPDLDNAPDVYETPDLVDDVSTLQATSAASPTSSTYDDAAESATEDRSGVDRSKLHPNEARDRFGPSRVDATDADFSDRAIGAGRSYRTSTRKHRDGQAEYGDSSDDEDENLDRKIARLRHEVESVKMELDRRRDKPPADDTESGNEEQDPATNIAKISEALDSVYTQRRGGQSRAEADLSSLMAKFERTSGVTADNSFSEPPAAAAGAPDPQLAQGLLKMADFDTRLSFLEKSLGLDGSNMPDQATNPPKPLLHTLRTLDQKIETLSDPASTLDAAQTKTRQLVKDAERLQWLRAAAAEEDSAASSPPPTSNGLSNGRRTNGGAYADDPERTARVNALYGALPTIEALAPSLPVVLERLRTLRLLHGAAAAAGGTLDGLEQRQAEQAAELAQWRAALAGVEAGLRDGKGALAENVGNVGQWVKELEARVARFA